MGFLYLGKPSIYVRTAEVTVELGVITHRYFLAFFSSCMIKHRVSEPLSNIVQTKAVKYKYLTNMLTIAIEEGNDDCECLSTDKELFFLAR